MNIQYVSDLHLEFWIGKQNGIPSVLALHPDADVLVLAGDIIAGDDAAFELVYGWVQELVEKSPKLKAPSVLIIAGNHEHYGRDVNESLAFQKQLADWHGFHFLENTSAQIDSVKFYGCTLWTDYSLGGLNAKIPAMLHADTYMSDAQRITVNGRRFLSKDAASMFETSKSGIASFLNAPTVAGDRRVVVSHHCPSHLSVGLQYTGDPLNGAFASPLLEGFSTNAVATLDLWIHGHTHTSFNYKFKLASVAANPAGYVRFLKSGEYVLENDAFDKGAMYVV